MDKIDPHKFCLHWKFYFTLPPNSPIRPEQYIEEILLDFSQNTLFNLHTSGLHKPEPNYDFLYIVPAFSVIYKSEVLKYNTDEWILKKTRPIATKWRGDEENNVTTSYHTKIRHLCRLDYWITEEVPPHFERQWWE